MNIREFLVGVVIFASTITMADAQTVKKGDVVFQTGVGLLPTYFMDKGKMLVPPVSASVDYRMGSILSVGAFGAYSSTETNTIKLEDGSAFKWQNDSWMAGVKVAAHSANFDRVDVYGGFTLGYQIPDIKANVEIPGEQRLPEPTNVKNHWIYAGFVGVAGYLTPHLGVYGELGYGISLLNVGVSIKI